MRNRKPKLNIEILRSIAKEKGFELLTEVYSPGEDLILKCKSGHIFRRRQDRLKRCKGCPKCPQRRVNGKSVFLKVKNEIEEKGFELLEEEYKTTTTKMKMKCKNGHVVYKTRDSTVRLGTGCAICLGLKKKTIEEVRELFSSRGFELISESYKDGKGLLKYKCKRGHDCVGSLINFRKNKYCCRKCYALENRGEKHYNWDPEKSEKERNRERQTAVYYEWRFNVLEKDKYTCQKCSKKGNKLEVHHIENFSSCIEKRYDVDNGITFCRTCHRKFHKIYGRTDNNRKQLNEFLGGM